EKRKSGSSSSPVVPEILLLLFSVPLIALAPGPATRALSAADAGAAPGRAPAATATNAGRVGPAAVSPAVSAGGYHTCGLKSDGHLLCWGYDSNYQVSHVPPT